MKFIPFPPTIAQMSRESAEAVQAERKAKARAGRVSILPQPFALKNVAVFRTKEGQMRVAYDLHDPYYPEGAEPLIGDVSFDVQHYANDTSGYVPHVTFAMTLVELATLMPVDLTAAALVSRDGAAQLVVVDSEEELSEMMAALDGAGTVSRATIRCHGTVRGERLEQFCATRAAAGTEIHAAATIGALHAGLKERYAFIEPEGEEASDFFEALRRHGRKFGWTVEFGDRQDLGLRQEKGAPEGPL